jgi:hypothetical protein
LPGRRRLSKDPSIFILVNQIMPSEAEIKKFAEQLYTKLLQNFNKKDSPFLLLTQDNATFSDLQGITSAAS